MSEGEHNEDRARCRGSETRISEAVQAALSAVQGDHAANAPRLFFTAAAEIARAEWDPARDWEGFVDALWAQVDAGFGLTPDVATDAVVPRAWFDHPDDGPVVVWGEGEGPG